ncbi:ABC transporter ATP-binding protein [Halovenus marina]|uniref:ABC transporter ATP-binding protein n=1 Tax=Halovenus marina TaxID=3396621 RepID=UPI003F57CC1D
MGSLRLSDVTKVFDGPEGEIEAVKDVSMEIEDGEFVVFVGPSGSGKSTLLRLIAGLETITDGELYLNDEEIGREKPKDRDLAMVFQNYALYPHLTARGNMSFGLKMAGEYSKEEIDSRVEEAANIMEIEDLLEKMPNELSGGQQQRVALGRAIVRDPEVFLMDEPLSNLDAKLRTTMRTELQQLQSRLDVTTLYVTHDQTEAMTMGDRIAILHDGELQQMGTPLETYYEPTNVFVAGFIGSPSMNFLTVDVEADGDEITFSTGDFEYQARESVAALGDLPERVIMGIRPEDIELQDERTRESIEVTVDVVEPLGSNQMLYFELGGKTFTAEVEGYHQIAEGNRILLRFPEHRMHLFDAETEQAIKNREAIEEDEAAAEAVVVED